MFVSAVNLCALVNGGQRLLRMYECWMVILFFFKQKTAYEIGVRLVGSEMCIRDSDKGSTTKLVPRLFPHIG